MGENNSRYFKRIRGSVLRFAAVLLCLAFLGAALGGCGALSAKVDINSTGPYTDFYRARLNFSEGEAPVDGTFYAKPDSGAEVRCVLPENSWVAVFGRQDGWLHCAAAGMTGWLPENQVQPQLEYEPGEPVPDFLPEQLQLLYLKALSFFEVYSDWPQNPSGAPGYPDWDRTVQTGGAVMYAESVYPTLTGLQQALDRVFTGECRKADYRLEGKDSRWTEQNGVLYAKQGDRGSWRAQLTGFTLQEKNDQKITFTADMHFGTHGDWNCSMPIEFVNTPQGWRVQQFSTVADDTRWAKAMGEGFDVFEAQGYITDQTFNEAGWLEKEVTTTPDGWKQTSVYNEEGDQIKFASYDDAGRLIWGQTIDYSGKGSPVWQMFASYQENDNSYLLTEQFMGSGFWLTRKEKCYDAESRELLWMKDSKYNASNQLLCQSGWDREGRLMGRTEYEYEGENQVLQKYSDGEGIEQWRYEYTYLDGKLAEERSFEKGVLRQRRGLDEEGREILTAQYDETGAPGNYCETRYENGLLPAESIERYPGGEQLSRHTWEYDGSGLVKKENIYDAQNFPTSMWQYTRWDTGSVKQETYTEYDVQGRRSRVVRTDYNGEGLKVKTAWHDQDDVLTGWEEYTYDKEGNGLKRFTFNAEGDMTGQFAFDEAVG